MIDWKSTLIDAGASLEQAIAIVNNSSLRVGMVVDENSKLLGVLTDGDIRRALLNKCSLGAPVELVMCGNPKTASSGWSRERMLLVMENLGIMHLPIVDNDRHIIGLATLQSLLDQRQVNNPVFLMAGGFGKRMHPLTNDCPKPLLKVGGKPILELILERFINAGFCKFFISTHYLPDMIRDYFGDGARWGVTIKYTQESDPLGTAGALSLLPKSEINLPLIISNGDLLTNIDFRSLLDFHNENDGIATMCVREYEYQVPYGVVEGDGLLVRAIVEKPNHKFFVNAGIYVVETEIFNYIDGNSRLDMTTLLECCIGRGQNVSMFPVHEYWLDIGRMEDFERAQTEVGGLG